MNSALADRFSFTINVDYLKPDQELKVLVAKTGIDDKTGGELIEVAQMTRLRAAAQQSIAAISTRRLIAWAKAIVAAQTIGKSLSITKAAQIAIVNRASSEHVTALQEIIDNKFRGR